MSNNKVSVWQRPYGSAQNGGKRLKRLHLKTPSLIIIFNPFVQAHVYEIQSHCLTSIVWRKHFERSVKTASFLSKKKARNFVRRNRDFRDDVTLANGVLKKNPDPRFFNSSYSCSLHRIIESRIMWMFCYLNEIRKSLKNHLVMFDSR